MDGEGQSDGKAQATLKSPRDEKHQSGCLKKLVIAVGVCLVLFAGFVVYYKLSQPPPVKIAWRQELPGYALEMHLRPGGGVVCTTEKSVIYFDSDGNITAEYEPSRIRWFTASCQDSKGNVYVSGNEGDVYALDPRGNERWKLHIKDESIVQYPDQDRETNLSLTKQGDLLVQTTNGELALISSEGSIERKSAYNFDFFPFVAPLQIPNGNVLVQDRDQDLACVDFDGHVLWQTKSAYKYARLQGVYEDRIIFTSAGHVVAVDFNGNYRWSYANPDVAKGLASEGFTHFWFTPDAGIYLATGRFVVTLDELGHTVNRVIDREGHGMWGLNYCGDDHFFVQRWDKTAFWSATYKLYSFNQSIFARSTRLGERKLLVEYDHGKEVSKWSLPYDAGGILGPDKDGHLYATLERVQYLSGAAIPESYELLRIDP